MKNIYGVYFICCIKHYLDIVKEQLSILEKGLLEKTTKLIIFITNYNENDCIELDKLLSNNEKFILIKSPENLYEKYAINNYKKYISDNDYYLYYFHTKGLKDINDQLFYVSISKRIILNCSLYVGDIINIYYNGMTNLVGNITTPTPSISWSINQAPINSNGIFLVEVSSATTFTTLTFSGTVQYVAGQVSYNLIIPISGDYGDELYYRIKNEKQYKTLCNSVVKSIKYSEVIPIKIGISSLNNY
jgi:hypothetical protein